VMDADAALVSRTLAGELGAFEQLVERHRDVVYRLAARVVGPEDAEDVAQDAFLRAFHRLPQFRRESAFRSWLLRITHNTALNALVRRRVLPVEDVEERAAVSQGARPHRTPAEELEVGERRERLAAKLRLLQPSHRAVLVLRDLEGFSYEEIAEVTEAPLGSVKGRLHRARRELIELLRNNTYDWELPAA
nr:sigma-70 family RNA polymerase sigma factor [Actinomycetota bacterium]